MELRPVYAWLNSLGNIIICNNSHDVDLDDRGIAVFAPEEIPDLIEDLQEAMREVDR